MFGTELHSTYKGWPIYLNWFGEYETRDPADGVEFCGFRSLATVRHSIRCMTERAS